MEREAILATIPIRNPEVMWEENKSGRVRIKVERKDILYSIIKALTGKVRIDKIPLDRYGSFVWKHIDGKTTIAVIQERLKEEYEEIENLEERTMNYLEALKEHQFVLFLN